MKYALVTGSTRGIGKAIADQLEIQGYIVIRNGRNENAETDYYIQADLSTEEGVLQLINEVAQYHRKLDCIVFSVGETCRKAYRDTSLCDMQKVMDTNVNIPFILAAKLYDYMEIGGSILFISSAMSLHPHATSIPYGVSKAAVNMLAQCLVKEYAPLQVRVNVVCPGFIDTQWQLEKPDWIRTKIEDKIALNRFGSTKEIAELSVEVCKNTYINGAVVSVDGGYNMLH